MLLPPASAVPFCKKLIAVDVALARRTFAFSVAAFTTDAWITGLKSRPFRSIVLPRMTKLSFTLKSTSSVVVAPALTVTGDDRLILIPDCAALGNVTFGLLVPVSFVPERGT